MTFTQIFPLDCLAYQQIKNKTSAWQHKFNSRKENQKTKIPRDISQLLTLLPSILAAGLFLHVVNVNTFEQ
jgi:hypothetical protein